MTEITLNVPDKFASQFQAASLWFPTIFELNIVGFKTPVAAASAEVIQFLMRNPSPQEVLDYYISDEWQERISNLLDMNREGEAGEQEQAELDEWMKFDHISIMLKTQAAKLIQREE
jgi:hypothetical protein